MINLKTYVCLQQTRAQGLIDLSQAKKVCVCPAVNHGFAFEIVSANRRHVLVSESEREREREGEGEGEGEGERERGREGERERGRYIYIYGQWSKITKFEK